MYLTVTGLVAIISYLLGSFYQGRSLLHAEENRRRVLAWGWLAVIAHMLLLYGLIVTTAGYDLGLYKVGSLFCWTIVTLVLLGSLRKPVENLLLLFFPAAALSTIAASLLDSSYTPHAGYDTGTAIHILLAILAYSLITIAAFQALLLAFQDYQLKDRHSIRLINRLPPLQTMEALLFEILWAGLFLLSAVIITGLAYMEDIYTQHLSHKLVLSIIAWWVFAILLWGRHKLGWRGPTAIRWTLTGFAFLVLAYFGSKLVLEIILNRS